MAAPSTRTLRSVIVEDEQPAVTDDVTKGHNPLDFWLDTDSGRLYYCADPAEGAADWRPLAVIADIPE